MNTKALESVVGNFGNAEYDELRARINGRFLANCQKSPLFTTNAERLFEAYLTFISADARQYHTCSACRKFIEKFGGLVTIDERGVIASAIWDESDAPDYYKSAIAAMVKLVRRAKVTGVFLSSKPVLGQPETGPWTHFAVTLPASRVCTRATQTAGQAMAEKHEDFTNVIRALEEFTEPMLDEALALLQTEVLYRSEHVIGPAQFLRNLHTACDGISGEARTNIVWLAVANAPAGFCHPRSSMIGTLLEDIGAGMDFGEVSRRFAAKMHPLQYQRPQAPPSAGNIAQAEKVVEQLRTAGSLERRFAHLEEIEALWFPKYDQTSSKGRAAGGGVFGHLKAKGKTLMAAMAVPAITMTWDKFSRTVLPTAESIEFFVEQKPDSYTALLTAVNRDAPPILQWDSIEKRNPVSWYVYHAGSLPSQWGLEAGRFCRVTAVTFQPSMWGDGKCSHQGQSIIFILDGAKDSQDAGNAIFPEMLRSEFHGIRATIEAYSRNAPLAGRDEASACGIRLQKGTNWNARFRVTSAGRSVEYRLDRWD